MLQTKNVRFRYNAKTMLNFPDIDCAKGSQWLLLGDSGSGKTTLLHLLAGLRKPTEGQIHINDQNIGALSGIALDQFRGQHIGIVFQQAHFLSALTIEENLLLAQKLAGFQKDQSRIDQLLDRLGIRHKAQDRPHNLSVGEQQRASIARALVNRPQLILADEPTSALDDHNCEEVMHLIRSQAKEDDVTLIIVTHDNRLKPHFEHQINLTNHQTT